MDLDQAIDTFEDAWRHGTPPAIGHFLAAAVRQDLDAPARRDVLCELVMIDLWHRWRRGVGQPPADAESPDSLPDRPCLEDYVAGYPALGPLEDLPPRVIAEEYRTRRRWGDPPAHEEFRARFPGRWAELEPMLRGIDAESTAHGAAMQGTSRNPSTRQPRQDTSKAGGRPEHPSRIGKYHVIDILDAGGQAELYRAVHPALAREVVIKLCRRAAAPTPAEQERLVTEGKILAEFEHPNMARVYDLDFEEGQPYLVMEYVRGRNLQRRAQEVRFTPREAAQLVAKVAHALEAAHARGIIHQDVKPGNIVLDEVGQPRLIDFGLARLRPAWAEQLQEPELISGTVQFMAPEQARGENQNIDPRSDIFALGAVLYYLLVGEAPFVAGSVAAALRRAARCEFDRRALRRRGVPRALASICLHAMQAKPADRYASAAQFAAALERFADRHRRWRWAPVGAGLAAVGLIVGGIWMLRGARDKPTAPLANKTSQADAVAILGRPLRRDFPLKLDLLGQTVDGLGTVAVSEGQTVALRVEADRECYLGIWHVDGKGAITLLFPNQHDQDSLLAAGQPRSIPGQGDYSIRVTPAEGQEYLHIAASSQRWEIPHGQQHGPYAVFASEEERSRWDRHLRGVILDNQRAAAVSECLVLLRVEGKP